MFKNLIKMYFGLYLCGFATDSLAKAHVMSPMDAVSDVINLVPIEKIIREIQRYDEPGSMPNQPRSPLTDT